MKRTLFPMCALFVLATVALAGDVKSGLEVGDHPDAFNVRDVTGPEKGTTLCYRCQYGGNPVACVFIREITDEVGALVKQLDETVGANKDKKMCSFVVLLTEDADGGAKKLEELAKSLKIKHVPLTVFDGKSGPEAYKISQDAAVTVLMWNKSRVQVNQAFAAGKMTKDDVKKVAGDTAKILK